MHSFVASVLLAAGSLAAAAATSGHGSSQMGTTMGPVSFLWPADRPWSAGADNTAPCGSTQGVGNRTQFPLTGGFVSLSIAEDAYDIDFSISYVKEPTAQSDFTQQVVETIAKVEAGHQCYKVAAFPSGVTAGSDATIQLEYRSKYPGENNGNDQTFYACADISLVETSAFTLTPACFNVTTGEFDAPTTTAPTSSESSGLSKGAIAGIAVGTIVGSLSIVGLVAYLVLRKRKSSSSAPANVEAGVATRKSPEVASVHSSLRH